MATDISKEINQLKNAVYGEEVRGAFISCMEKIHEENESYDNIKAQVAQSAENVEKQVGAINVKAEEVQTSLDNLADAISNGKKQQTAIEQSVEKGKTQQTNLEETIKNAKTQQSAMIEELEENSNTQVNNFNTHVAEKTQQSEQTIADARQQAVQTVTKQGELSVQTVKDETAEYIEEQKNTAKEEINSRADEKIEEINQVYKPLDEKVELLNEDVDTLKNDTKELNDKKITKFYTSNQGETHITDSDNGKISDMRVYGRSEQKQYRGKNLLPTTMYSKSVVQNGLQFTNNGDGSVTVSGTATDITYFALWGYNELSDKGILPGLKVGDTVFVSDCLLQETNSKELLKITTNSAVTINSSTTTMFVGIKINKNTTVNKTYYPQIEKGSEATSYEPYVGGQPSPSLDYPQEIKSVVNPVVKICGKNLLKATLETQEEYKEQVATFPYTLNAIPVTKDGNYTDKNGQQYIADFVDIERKKLVRVVKKAFLQQTYWKKISFKGVFRFYNTTSAALKIEQNLISEDNISMSSHFNFTNTMPDTVGQYTTNATGVNSNIGFAFTTDAKITSDDFNEWISKNNPFVLFKLSKQEEIDLTDEELEAFKKLETYYPVTNILTTSDELDGYTTFNYLVSLENGWNYVKQQLSDSRDYIYNIDNRAQEIDMQSAEAYVNSEYAVALTELEV